MPPVMFGTDNPSYGHKKGESGLCIKCGQIHRWGGRKKCGVPWNRGLTKETNAILKMISDDSKEMFAIGKRIPSNLGKHWDKERIEKFSNGQKGISKSKEHKQKISSTLKTLYKNGILIAPLTGKHHTMYSNEKNRKAHLGKKLTPEHKAKISSALLNSYQTGKHKLSLNTGRSKQGYRTDLGHWCRSSWEANYCRNLKSANIEYDYEPKAFVVNVDGKLCTYRPDLYVRPFIATIGNEKITSGGWTEIKGYLSDYSRKKILAFEQQYNQKIRLVDWKTYKAIKLLFGEFTPNWEK